MREEKKSLSMSLHREGWNRSLESLLLLEKPVSESLDLLDDTLFARPSLCSVLRDGLIEVPDRINVFCELIAVVSREDKTRQETCTSENVQRNGRDIKENEDEMGAKEIAFCYTFSCNTSSSLVFIFFSLSICRRDCIL